MRAGRTITEQDREKARQLIARVDEKIKQGLLQVGPVQRFGRWINSGWPSWSRRRGEDSGS